MPTPASVYREGTIQIPQTFPLDLETGKIQDTAGSGDIWFQAVTDDKRYLSPAQWNGAGLSLFGETEPGEIGCATANTGDNDVPVEFLTPGVFLCARTNERRIAEIKIVSSPGPSSRDASIGVQYTVYSK